MAAQTWPRVFFFGRERLVQAHQKEMAVAFVLERQNASPGRAPGMTTRFLLSAMTVIMGRDQADLQSGMQALFPAQFSAECRAAGAGAEGDGHALGFSGRGGGAFHRHAPQ